MLKLGICMDLGDSFQELELLGTDYESGVKGFDTIPNRINDL
jgi:hypothetical protein